MSQWLDQWQAVGARQLMDFRELAAVRGPPPIIQGARWRAPPEGREGERSSAGTAARGLPPHAWKTVAFARTGMARWQRTLVADPSAR